MSKFALPMSVARLYPCLTGSDAIFIKEKQALGYNHVSAFLLLLESKGIDFPSGYTITPLIGHGE